MRTTPTHIGEVFAKRARLLEEKAERAEVRRARALELGNQREADGAMKTAEESHDSARRLRAQIGQ